MEVWGERTWYLVKSVLQTPVSSIMATRNGIVARAGMIDPIVVGDLASGAGCVEEEVQSRQGVWIRAPGRVEPSLLAVNKGCRLSPAVSQSGIE